VLVANSYSVGIFDGVLSTAERNNYNVIVFTQAWKSREESEPWLSERKTDGLIILAPSIDSDMVNALADMNIPLVGVGADSLILGIPTVDVDNLKGAMLATEHLIGLGHRRIAHLCGTMSQTSAQTRLDAFRRVMSTHGLKVPDEYIIETGYEAIGTHNDVRRLMTGENPPTAIFAANDSIARTAIHAATEMGFDVPGRLSVIGYDDAQFAADMHPGLTTIHQPLAEIGSMAVNLLFKQRAGEPVEVQTYLLAPALIVRGTTARAE
jgi:DNA-binding LacI/PurR family transcriptional regulator